MNKKIIIIIIISLTIISFFAGSRIYWRFQCYKLNDESAYNDLKEYIDKKWIVSGLDYDGFEACVFLSKYHKLSKEKFSDIVIKASNFNKVEFASIMNNNIEKGWIPFNISITKKKIYILFVKYENQPEILAYNLGVYNAKNNSNETMKAISNKINIQIEKGYQISGFAYDNSTYYILFTATSNSKNQNKYWSIDWILNDSKSVDKYIKKLYEKNLTILDIDFNGDYLGIIWTS